MDAAFRSASMGILEAPPPTHKQVPRVKWVNEELKLPVLQTYKQILKDVEPRGFILDKMFQDGIISDNEMELIRNIARYPTRKDRVQAMMTIVIESEQPNSFLVLRDALAEDYQHVVEEINQNFQSNRQHGQKLKPKFDRKQPHAMVVKNLQKLHNQLAESQRRVDELQSRLEEVQIKEEERQQELEAIRKQATIAVEMSDHFEKRYLESDSEHKTELQKLAATTKAELRTRVEELKQMWAKQASQDLCEGRQRLRNVSVQTESDDLMSATTADVLSATASHNPIQRRHHGQQQYRGTVVCDRQLITQYVDNQKSSSLGRQVNFKATFDDELLNLDSVNETTDA